MKMTSMIYLLIGCSISEKEQWIKLMKSHNIATNIQVIDMKLIRKIVYGNDIKFSTKKEKAVLNIRDSIITNFLKLEHYLIIDDLIYYENSFTRLCNLADKIGDAVIVKHHFSDNNFQILKEEYPFISNKMHNTIKNNILSNSNDEVYYSLDTSDKRLLSIKNYIGNDKQKAIIVDIDGTLAIMSDRSPYAISGYINDKLNIPLRDMINKINYNSEYKIIILTGRNLSAEDETKKWLEINKIQYDEFYIRDKDNYSTPDNIFKESVYNKYIKPRYNVVAVFDDRNQVVDMWRRNDLPVYQVYYGDF